jgi:predicted PurR-regulated permease PerM
VLLDEKLGAFVRGQLLMIAFVSTVLSAGFFAIGLPYWLLIGVFAGIVEIVPVVGPLAAGALAVGVGLTQSWHTALFAALIVTGVRQFQDYVVVPRVLGHVTGLPPILVLVSATGIGVLLGPFYVLLAVPITAVVVTLVDVIVRGVEPADQEVPALLFTREESS